MLSGRFKVWTQRHFQSLAKEKEARSVAKRGFMAVLSHITQMCARVTLGCSWIVLFLLASTGLADAADYTWRGQQQQGGGHQGDDTQSHKDPHHLEIEDKTISAGLSF